VHLFSIPKPGSCLYQLAPTRQLYITLELLLTAASFRTWRGS